MDRGRHDADPAEQSSVRARSEVAQGRKETHSSTSRGESSVKTVAALSRTDGTECSRVLCARGIRCGLCCGQLGDATPGGEEAGDECEDWWWCAGGWRVTGASISRSKMLDSAECLSEITYQWLVSQQFDVAHTCS